MKVVCTVAAKLNNINAPISIESCKGGKVNVVAYGKKFEVDGEELKTAVDKCLC